MNALSELSKKRLISYACIMGGVIAWMLWGLLQPPTSGPCCQPSSSGRPGRPPPRPAELPLLRQEVKSMLERSAGREGAVAGHCLCHLAGRATQGSERCLCSRCTLESMGCWPASMHLPRCLAPNRHHHQVTTVTAKARAAETSQPAPART